MTAEGRYRAWRFVHPDLVGDEAALSGGLQVSPRGRVEMVEGDQSVRQSLLLLLSTSPGERVMRPEYGCNLRRLVFAPNDETTAGLAIHYVRTAVERWEPRVEVLALDATRETLQQPSERDRDADARAPRRPPLDALVISLEYRVRSTGRQDALTYTLELAGEGR